MANIPDQVAKALKNDRWKLLGKLFDTDEFQLYQHTRTGVYRWFSKNPNDLEIPETGPKKNVKCIK